MQSFLALVLFVLSTCASAASGFYAVVHTRTISNWIAIGAKSSCFVLPSMAIYSVLRTSSNSVTVTSLAVNGYWVANAASSTPGTYSGLFYPCEDAAFGTMPNFASGVSDPALSSPVLSGSAASSETVDVLQTTVTGLQSTIATQQATLSTLTNAQAEEFDITKALAAFSFFFGSIVLLWSVAKGGGMVLASIRGRRRW